MELFGAGPVSGHVWGLLGLSLCSCTGKEEWDDDSCYVGAIAEPAGYQMYPSSYACEGSGYSTEFSVSYASFQGFGAAFSRPGFDQASISGVVGAEQTKWNALNADIEMTLDSSECPVGKSNAAKNGKQCVVHGGRDPDGLLAAA